MVHVPVVVPPETLPFKLILTAEEQTVVSFPAFTRVGGVMVNINESATVIQELSGVSVSITLPLVISAALGV